MYSLDMLVPWHVCLCGYFEKLAGEFESLPEVGVELCKITLCVMNIYTFV
jgi:hypothetical protein